MTTAKSVRIGSTIFHDFRFYLVIENKRDIALLGFDFLDKCKCTHEPNGNYILSEFDDIGYEKDSKVSINADEIVAYLDSLSND